MTDLLASIRESYGERARETPQDITILAGDNVEVTLAKPPPRADAKLQAWVRSALTAVTGLASDMARVRRDPNLSDTGKRAALDKPRRGSATLTAAVYAGFIEYQRSVQAAAARRYGPPVLPTSPGELSVALARHREIRDFVRGLEPAQAMRHLNAALDAARAGDVEAREFISAVMTPTFGALAVLREHAQRVWQQLVDVDDPAGRIALDDEKAGCEWAQRALFQLATHVRTVGKLEDDELLPAVCDTGGAAAFGINDARVALFKQDEKYRKQRETRA